MTSLDMMAFHAWEEAAVTVLQREMAHTFEGRAGGR